MTVMVVTGIWTFWTAVVVDVVVGMAAAAAAALELEEGVMGGRGALVMEVGLALDEVSGEAR